MSSLININEHDENISLETTLLVIIETVLKNLGERSFLTFS
jgi:hypothetical protein